MYLLQYRYECKNFNCDTHEMASCSVALPDMCWSHCPIGSFTNDSCVTKQLLQHIVIMSTTGCTFQEIGKSLSTNRLKNYLEENRQYNEHVKLYAESFSRESQIPLVVKNYYD